MQATEARDTEVTIAVKLHLYYIQFFQVFKNMQALYSSLN